MGPQFPVVVHYPEYCEEDCKQSVHYLPRTVNSCFLVIQLEIVIGIFKANKDFSSLLVFCVKYLNLCNFQWKYIKINFHEFVYLQKMYLINMDEVTWSYIVFTLAVLPFICYTLVFTFMLISHILRVSINLAKLIWDWKKLIFKGSFL